MGVRRPSGHRRGAIASALLLAGALCFTPGALAAAAPVPATSCVRLCIPASFTPKPLVLTAAANGRTYRLFVGEEVLFVLRARSASGPDWTSPRVAPAGVLRAVPLLFLPPRGVTELRLRAERVGTAQVTAELPACPPAPPGGVACLAVLGFTVTLQVVARPGGAAPG